MENYYGLGLMEICKIDGCEINVIEDDYCRKHYIEAKEAVFLDNSDWDDMGITKWLKFMYPEHYRNNFSLPHLEVYKTLLELYDPRYTNKLHRLRELIAYRSFAKSKTIFGIFSYLLAHNDMEMIIKSLDGVVQTVRIRERLMVIFSETGGMAEDFVVNIRDEFSTNRMLKWFYPYEIQDAKESDTGQWTRKAFKFNNCFLLGLGAGQQARGKIKGAYRPTFIVHDDIYSENNVKTEDRRKTIKDWFYNAANNSVDDVDGKILLVGTIVHDDTVLVECENSNTWRTLKYYPMPISKFREFLKKFLKVSMDRDKCELPFEEDEVEFRRIAKQQEFFKEQELTGNWEIAWSERVGLYLLSSKYKEAVENQAVAGFYQEYFHITIPNELKRFRPEYFQEIPGEWSISYEFGYNWFHCPELFNAPQIISIEFGLDLASGTKEGDNVVINVSGMLSDGKLIVLDEKAGKFSMRDNLEEDSAAFSRNDRVLTSNSFVSKIGWIDETFRLALKYNPRIIKIGSGGGLEPTVVVETRRVLRANGIYTTVLPRIQNSSDGDKFNRIDTTLLPFYETMSVYHRKGLNGLEYELEFLRKAKNDDRPDALEVAAFNMQRPGQVNYSLFTQEPEVKKKKSWIRSETFKSDDWKCN